MNELVFVDCDDTLLSVQSQRKLINYLSKTGKISSWRYVTLLLWFVLYKLRIINNPRKALEFALISVRNKTISEIDEFVNSFFESELIHFIRPEIVAIIREHKRNHRRVILISNTLDIVLRCIASYLDILEYQGTELEVKRGFYTGKIKGDIMYGLEKVRYIKSISDSSKASIIWVYSDHYSDIPIMEIADKPIAVCPEPRLREFSLQHQWQILDF